MTQDLQNGEHTDEWPAADRPFNGDDSDAPVSIDNNARLGPRLTLALLAEAERMARESVEGQAIELGWRRDNAVTLAGRRLQARGR